MPTLQQIPFHERMRNYLDRLFSGVADRIADRVADRLELRLVMAAGYHEYAEESLEIAEANMGAAAEVLPDE